MNKGYEVRMSDSRAVSVDVESDGPAAGIHSMVCFGAVIVESGFTRTFYAKTRPISDIWVPEALAISGFTREEHLEFPDPLEAMINFKQWLADNIKGRPRLYSDNNGYDAAFINYYFHRFTGDNPFGWSSSNIGDFYKGINQNLHKRFTFLRDTKHTHHPVDDARGNAEALLKMLNHIEGKAVLPKDGSYKPKPPKNQALANALENVLKK